MAAALGLANEIRINRDEVAASVQRYHAAWRKTLAEKDAIVAYSARTRTTPPHNYWEAESKARERMFAAMAVLYAIDNPD